MLHEITAHESSFAPKIMTRFREAEVQRQIENDAPTSPSLLSKQTKGCVLVTQSVSGLSSAVGLCTILFLSFLTTQAVRTLGNLKAWLVLT